MMYVAGPREDEDKAKPSHEKDPLQFWPPGLVNGCCHEVKVAEQLLCVILDGDNQ